MSTSKSQTSPGERVRQMRHRRDMSAEEVAERAGIDPSVIEAIEAGYPQASYRRSGEQVAVLDAVLNKCRRRLLACWLLCRHLYKSR